jgi:hypothetical protein
MTMPSVTVRPEMKRRRDDQRKSLTIWRQLMVVFALMALGGHLSFLQIAAWTGMVIVRTPEQGFAQAVASTFSGDQPCSLCHVVQRLKAADDLDTQKPDRPAPHAPLDKIDKPSKSVIPNADAILLPSVVFVRLTWTEQIQRPPNDVPEPPVPPPRLIHT